MLKSSLKSSLTAARAKFAEAGISAVDAELLAAHILRVNRMELHARLYELTLEEQEEFAELIERRLGGEPVQYLIGTAPFRYLEFEVGPGVLIPRPETELLVDAALVEIERLQSSNTAKSERTSVVDLGSGSGAIAISIAEESRRRGLAVTVVAVEKEASAVEWLKRNIAKHDVEVRLIESDIKDALIDVRADIVIANPPYIPAGTELPKEVKDFEPTAALFGGVSGIETPLAFIESAARILKPGGFFALEHFETQAKALAEAMAGDYFEIAHFEDLNQRSRWLTARRRG